jgi:hypothetical protein
MLALTQSVGMNRATLGGKDVGLGMGTSTEAGTKPLFDPLSLSLHLRARREEILERWEAAVRSEMHQAAPRESPALQNSLPTFLSDLAKTLSGTHTEATLNELTTCSKIHGEERAHFEGYTID